ncbi:hypothetical protein THASP1DRAFT_14944 [Thamnocephalis sphaerospora]|uniref:ERCC4 domain-containing protein n=1 Tax=Thamnocephalis sphaerospora TaxID=78915 RepID=A0A4P9XS52_9FUNG|nr:hypothetical protein THASP1DRAFT_14944 [Thamnocephalis sphaerospora]|eukprot:RKP08935.1 hypothetical protein THASP1DRAFT_14944 [Thamnocephalis sphaerospora]
MALQLPFQRQIFTELLEEDGLLVLAKGLGLQRLLAAFLQLAAERHTLVVLLNAPADEEERLRLELAELTSAQVTLNVLKNDVKAEDRVEAYRRGGLISVTSRIFVVDLLKKRVPVPLITGILVANAQKVTPYSLEAFVLRLYRQENAEGFIKAFTESPETFGVGFAPLETTLKALQLRKVHLWPRFHVAVKESLDTSEEVVELRQPMTDRMMHIQGAIIDCIDACLSELRRAHTSVSANDQLTVENALLRSFDFIVRQQLDPVWHQVSARTKHLVGDLQILRQLLTYLISYDCVTFNMFLETLITSSGPASSGKPMQSQLYESPWMLLDSANVLFSSARDRVYKRNGPPGAAAVGSDGIPVNMEPVLEEQPKWKLLRETLVEIENAASSQKGSVTIGAQWPVLVMVQDERTAAQLRVFLTEYQGTTREDAAKRMLTAELTKYFAWKTLLSSVSSNAAAAAADRVFAGSLANCRTDAQPSSRGGAFTGRGRQPASKRRRTRGASAAASSVDSRTARLDSAEEKHRDGIASHLSSWLIRCRNMPNLNIVAESLGSNTAAPEERADNEFGLLDEDSTVMIRAYAGSSDARLLEDLRPLHIIIYEPDPTFVRQIELYRALHPRSKIQVYFMMYENSVEEQRYLSVIRREKASFERLIHEKSVMAIPLPIKGRPGVESEEDLFIKVYNSRLGGAGRAVPTPDAPKVVVDMREFRSTLPSILHEKGLDVVPRTLIVGDYVLSPEICIERKSISDLISSFNSGRLYTQSEAMCSRYEIPVLLIEFDQQKAFSLQAVSDIGTEISMGGITSKLALLALAFPRLRIIWSSSVYATADIFHDLKKKHAEPDADQAAMVGANDEEDAQLSLNQASQVGMSELLRSLPGVNAANYRSIARRVHNIQDLGKMSQQELSQLMGEASARQLYAFFRDKP